MKKNLFRLLVVVAFATSVAVASSSESSVRSDDYPQCDSYKPTEIQCYTFDEGTCEFNPCLQKFYLHTNKEHWKVYFGAGMWGDVVESDRCEYRYMARYKKNDGVEEEYDYFYFNFPE